MVRDTLTGLQWQGCEAGLSGFDCDTGSSILFKWESALAYCENLSHGGHTDWRLPNRVELQSIDDLRRVYPSIDTAVFPATDSFGFWSSSSNASQPSHAWFVNFNLGQVADAGKTSNLRVRCVRSAP
jgi:hypothetical protein